MNSPVFRAPGTDQVDSTSQFVNWAEERFRRYGFNPELIVLENTDPWLT